MVRTWYDVFAFVRYDILCFFVYFFLSFFVPCFCVFFLCDIFILFCVVFVQYNRGIDELTGGGGGGGGGRGGATYLVVSWRAIVPDQGMKSSRVCW